MLKGSEAKVICDPSLFLARTTEKPLSHMQKLKIYEAKAVYSPPFLKAGLGKPTSLMSAEKQDRHQLNLKDFAREGHGSAFLAKESAYFCDSSFETEEDLLRCSDSLINMSAAKEFQSYNKRKNNMDALNENLSRLV